MRGFALLALLFINGVNNHDSFAQNEKKIERVEKFVKLNLEVDAIDSKNFVLGNWQPGFVWGNSKEFFEAALIDLEVSRGQIVTEYITRNFISGVRFVYKRNFSRPVWPLMTLVGLGLESSYHASHSRPLNPDIHKEFYLKMVSCGLFFDLSFVCKLSKKVSVDCDLPFDVLRCMVWRQRDILPISRDERILSDWNLTPPEKYMFNFRIGLRYRLNSYKRT